MNNSVLGTLAGYEGFRGDDKIPPDPPFEDEHRSREAAPTVLDQMIHVGESFACDKDCLMPPGAWIPAIPTSSEFRNDGSVSERGNLWNRKSPPFVKGDLGGFKSRLETQQRY